jgi:hypothetical protein
MRNIFFLIAILHEQTLDPQVRVWVFTSASMKIVAFWDIAPCRLAETVRRFRGVHCLHHQGDERSASYPPLKRRSTSIRLHGAVSQKAVPSLDLLVSKSKAVPLHAMEALGGRGGIAPTHSRPRH